MGYYQTMTYNLNRALVNKALHHAKSSHMVVNPLWSLPALFPFFYF